MTDDIPRRFSDEMLIRLDQKVTDQIEFVQKELKELHARLLEMEKFRSDVEKPIHAAGWIIIGLVGSFVAAVGTYLWRLISRLHFPP